MHNSGRYSTSVPLSAVADPHALIVYGIVQPGPDAPDGVPFVQSRDVGGLIAFKTLQCTTAEIAAQYRRSKIAAGDILFSLRGNIGQSSLAPKELDGANIARGIARIRVNGSFDAAFIRYALQGPTLERLIARNANGSTFREISIEELRKLPIPNVPLSEQRKIAAILRTWDLCLEMLSTLRKTKAQRLDALRAALLFGSMRTAETRSNWPLRRLGEVTRELAKRNSKLALDRVTVMGVSNSRGIVPMREQTVADDISRYKVLPPLGFAYNPMRINVGSIAMNAREATFLVSPDYVVFACRRESLEPDYLDHLRQTQWWLHHINAGGSGSVRQRTYYEDLAALQLCLPAIEEQRAIVAVLNAARADLDLTDREIATLTRQKRGLMQKLLTGEGPVKPDSDSDHD